MSKARIERRKLISRNRGKGSPLQKFYLDMKFDLTGIKTRNSIKLIIPKARRERFPLLIILFLSKEINQFLGIRYLSSRYKTSWSRKITSKKFNLAGLSKPRSRKRLRGLSIWINKYSPKNNISRTNLMKTDLITLKSLIYRLKRCKLFSFQNHAF